jgi:hypothetical protein
MLSRAHAATTKPQPQPVGASAVRQPGWALLELVGGVTGQHALIIGTHAVGLVCDLLCRGATAGTLLRPERPEADLAIVPKVSDPEELAVAVTHVRRALTPARRIILCIVAAPRQRMAEVVVRALRLQGFSAVRARSAIASSSPASSRPSGRYYGIGNQQAMTDIFALLHGSIVAIAIPFRDARINASGLDLLSAPTAR